MASSTLAPGTRLGTYEILATLGEGGMGAVYRARDTKLNRDVAIKVLLPDVAGNPERIARFQREAEVLAALNHPRIAAIYGLEEQGSAGPFLVLELVDGPTLGDRVAQGPRVPPCHVTDAAGPSRGSNRSTSRGATCVLNASAPLPLCSSLASR